MACWIGKKGALMGGGSVLMVCVEREGICKCCEVEGAVDLNAAAGEISYGV